MKKKTLVLSLALLALGGGGAVLSTIHHGGRGASVAPSAGGGTEETAPAGAAAKAALSDRARAPGLRHTYATRFDQDVALAGGSGGAHVRIRASGELTLAFVAHVDGKERWFAELSGAKLDLGARSPRTEAVEREIARPFYVIAEPDGRLRGYVFPRELSPTAQNVLRGIVGSAQLAVRDEAAWTAKEDDIQGTYVASYTRTGAEIVKTKGKYEQIATMTSLVPADEAAAVETRARGVATMGDDGWATKIALEEHKKASMGANMPTATTDAHLEMTLTGTKADPSLLGRFEREADGLAAAGPFGTGNEAEAQRTADQRAAGDATMEALLAQARATEEDKDVGAVADRMAARLRLSPDDADRVAPLARSLRDREARTLVSALGSAGTKESARALGKIVGDKGAPSGVRAQAATQLAFSGEHALEAREPLIQGLGDASRDVRESSALALGNVARELGDGDTDSVSELVHRYEQAQTDEERALFLRALGNSGSPEVLPIARRALASESVPLREAAAHALRFLPVGEADAVLSRILVEDPAEDVRLATVDAIGYRIVEMHLSAFERAIAADANGRLRAAIGEVATRALNTRGKTLTPQARQALEALIRKTA